MSAILEVKDLSVTLKLAEGDMTAVQDLNIDTFYFQHPYGLRNSAQPLDLSL